MAKVLIVNPPDPICGVACFGSSLFDILKKSTRHKYEITCPWDDLENDPDVAIFNYHEKLMPWLSNEHILRTKIPCMAIGGHDCYPDFAALKFILNCDSTSEHTERNIPLPRPVKKFSPLPDPEIVTIGSCGFDFSSKNYQHVATVVAQSYDEAKIHLHIPHHPCGEGIQSIAHVIKQQLWALNKPKISVEISTNFLNDGELISLLTMNTANVFLYPPYENEQRGLSSVIDKALSARKPIAISDSTMYRHINTEDKFLLSRHSLKEIISFGTDHIKPFWEAHSEEKLIETVDNIIDKCLN
jgi:hypothetical protein